MERFCDPVINRRSFLHNAGLGVFAAVGAHVPQLLTPRETHAGHVTHAYWVHGITVLSLQNVQAKRLGTEAQFILGGADFLWGFQFPLTNPVILNTQRLHLSAVMLRFSTTAGPTDRATMERVSVFDGDIQLADHTVNLSGFQDFVRLEVPEHYPLYWGLNIAMLVRVARDIRAAQISFIAAGADLV
jgi:hypothetical protein